MATVGVKGLTRQHAIAWLTGGVVEGEADIVDVPVGAEHHPDSTARRVPSSRDGLATELLVGSDWNAVRV